MITIVGAPGSGTATLANALHTLLADPLLDRPPHIGYAPSSVSNVSVVNLNRDVLTARGGTWSSPPSFPDGWVTASSLRPLRERAENLSHQIPRGSVVEDPVFSLVQPLWEAVGPVHSTVICLRHPRAVARTLEKSDRFDQERGLFLWFRYFAAAAMNQPNGVWVEYESLNNDPSAQLIRIADHLGMESAGRSLEAAVGTISPEFVDEADDDLPSTPIGIVSRRLYDLLRSGAPLDSDETTSIWARLVTELPWSGPDEHDLLRARREVAEIGLQLQRVTKENRQSNRRLRRLEAELQVALTRIDDLAATQTHEFIQSLKGIEA